MDHRDIEARRLGEDLRVGNEHDARQVLSNVLRDPAALQIIREASGVAGPNSRENLGVARDGDVSIIDRYTQSSELVGRIAYGNQGYGGQGYNGANGFSERQPGWNQGYNPGYNGAAPGYSQGYNPGYSQGYNPGYSQGYNPGYNQGYNPGYNQGYNPGYNQGYNPGYNQGYNPGYSQGYNPGYNGYNPGQIVTGMATGAIMGMIIGGMRGHRR